MFARISGKNVSADTVVFTVAVAAQKTILAFLAEREYLPFYLSVRKGGGGMAGHPGVLNTKIHKEGPPNALTDVSMKHFPISDEQVEAAAARGETVYEVSVGQRVRLRNGAGYNHGKDDGLHVQGDDVFE